MRAAILHKAGGTPEVGEFDDPGGDDVVEVRLAGLNPVDLAMASGGMGEPTTPSIVGQEGVGTRRDGQRVYFNFPPDRSARGPSARRSIRSGHFRFLTGSMMSWRWRWGSLGWRRGSR